MTPYKRHMHQVLTYWEFDGVDMFGKPTFKAPVNVKCRWQDQMVLFRDAQGQQRTSSAVIYPEFNLTLKSWVKLGEHTDLNPVGLPGAFEILNSGFSPNLSGTIALNKVFI